jgi:stage V sporulation protein G
MEITEVRLTLRSEDRLKAFVSITFDNAFVVRGLKVIEGNDGLFVAMPSRRRKDGEFRDIAHPINNETRQMIEDAVFAEYRSQVALAAEGGGGQRRLPEGELVHAEDACD